MGGEGLGCHATLMPLRPSTRTRAGPGILTGCRGCLVFLCLGAKEKKAVRYGTLVVARDAPQGRNTSCRLAATPALLLTSVFLLHVLCWTAPQAG